MLLMSLIAIAVIQQVLDAWSTVKALETGRAKEMNGPLNYLMKKVGVKPALVIVKVPMIYVLIASPAPTLAWYAGLCLIIAGYSWLLYNNFSVLRRIGAL